jgi:hypothetical protein
LIEEVTQMTDTSRYSDSKAHTTPRWVRVFGIIALVVVVLVVVMLLFGGGRHGPSRHMPGRDTGKQGMQQPLVAAGRLPA